MERRSKGFWRRPAARRRPRLVACLLLLSSLTAAQQSGTSSPQQGPSLLFGGASVPRLGPAIIDPRLPRGSLRHSGTLDETLPEVCSLTRPVCVHAHHERDARAVLPQLERAFEEHVFGSALPAPLPDDRQVRIRWQLDPSERELTIGAAEVPSRGFARSRGHCHGGSWTLETARRCTTELAVLALAPASAPWLRAGYAAEQALVRGAAPEARQQLAASVPYPDVGVLTNRQTVAQKRDESQLAPVSQLRSALFFHYLQSRSVAAGPGRAGWAALTMAPTIATPESPRHDAEPDLMDVLRATLGEDRTALARLFDDFAHFRLHQVRPWLGLPQDPNAQPELAWDLAGSSLPRSVALTRPLGPTGSAYVRVRFDQPPPKAGVAVRTYCEAPVSYVWSIARLNDRGEEISRIPVAFLQRQSDADQRVEQLEGTHSLLIVGTNLGGVDLAHPFDPDHGPHETHGCSLYVTALPPPKAEP